MQLLVGEHRSEGLKAGGLPGLISLRLAAGEPARALAEVLGSAALLQTLPHSLAPSGLRCPRGDQRAEAQPLRVPGRCCEPSSGTGRTWSSVVRCVTGSPAL